MISKFLKIGLLITSFIFLSGFLPFASLLGPGITIASSGNFYKAGAQFFIDSTIKKKTGKNSLAFVKDEVQKQNNKKDFDQNFRELVKNRVSITHKKLTEQDIKKDLNQKLKQLLKKRIIIVQKQINLTKTNQ